MRPPFGLLALGFGALGALFVGSIISDDDDVRLGGPQGSEGNKDSLVGTNPAAAAAALDCNQALEIFAAREGVEAANELATVINNGTNVAALREVGLGLEARAAGAPDLPTAYRAALLRLARCVFDKVATMPPPQVQRAGQMPLAAANNNPREIARRTISQYQQPAAPTGDT